jgi:protein-disulfide isomerase-like protein with CxxC motif
MSEIEFENDNKEVLDRCCKIIDHKPAIRAVNKASQRESRRKIEDILEAQRIEKSVQLDY